MRPLIVALWLLPASLYATADTPLPGRDLRPADVLVRESIDRARAALVQDPADAEHWARLGAVYQAHSFWTPSAEALAEALAHQPDRAKWHYWRSLALRQAGANDEATAILARLAVSRPEYKPLRWRLGDWLLADGDLEGAESVFRRLLSEYEADPVARVGLATTLLERADFAAAARELETALRHDPSNRHAGLLLGRALAGVGRHREARRFLAYHRGAQRGFDDPWQAEIKAMTTGIAAETDRAQHLSNSGRREEAVAVLEPLVALYPDDPLLLNKLAEVELVGGRVEQAITWLDRAAHLEGSRALTAVHLAQAHRALGDLEEAHRRAAAACALDPAFWPAFMELSTVLQLQGDVEGSLDALERALELGLDNQPDHWIRLGFGRLSLGHFERAVAVFERASRRFPFAAGAFAGLAIARAESGDLQAAQAALDEAMALGPRERLVLQAGERLRRMAAADEGIR